MGLAKKGTRQIRIDETDYRWVVSADDGFMRIAVEKFEGPGQRLSVQVNYLDGSYGQTQKITPAMIRQIVRKAASLGWNPHQRATEFLSRLTGDELVPLR